MVRGKSGVEIARQKILLHLRGIGWEEFRRLKLVLGMVGLSTIRRAILSLELEKKQIEVDRSGGTLRTWKIRLIEDGQDQEKTVKFAD